MSDIIEGFRRVGSLDIDVAFKKLASGGEVFTLSKARWHLLFLLLKAHPSPVHIDELSNQMYPEVRDDSARRDRLQDVLKNLRADIKKRTGDGATKYIDWDRNTGFLSLVVEVTSPAFIPFPTTVKKQAINPAPPSLTVNGPEARPDPTLTNVEKELSVAELGGKDSAIVILSASYTESEKVTAELQSKPHLLLSPVLDPPHPSSPLADPLATFSSAAFEHQDDCHPFFKSTHDELLDALEKRAQTVLFTANPGLGQTCLLNQLRATKAFLVLYLQAAQIGQGSEGLDRLYLLLSKQLKLPISRDAKVQVSQCLLDLRRQQSRVLLILHWLPDQRNVDEGVLDEIRTLNSKGVQLVFVGKPSLEMEWVSLRSINFHARLEPLDEYATGRYVIDRLSKAGVANADEIFPPDILQEIHARSDGYPITINFICNDLLATRQGSARLAD